MTTEQPPVSNSHSYGSGLCYSLALFLTHEANVKYAMAEAELLVTQGAIKIDVGSSSDHQKVQMTVEELAASRWFFHAARSVRDLVIPNSLPTDLRDRLDHFHSKCVQWSFPSHTNQNPSLSDVRWAVGEAKELIRHIDELHGISTHREHPDVQAQREPCLVIRDE